jgi:ectoine hydroxylase-related dioxygenase (phytanoyl-CoA dioxygenase family)
MIPTQSFELSLSEETNRTFHRDGLVTIPRLTTDVEAGWFRGVYDRLLSDRLSARLREPRASRGAGNNTLWMRLNQWEALVLNRTVTVHNAKRLAAALLGARVEELQVGLRFFFKPANGGGPVPWHQDEAHYEPGFDYRSLNVWVPFDHVNPDNGCLWYIPRSHLGGVRVHRHPGGGAPEVALMTDDVDLDEAVSVPLAAAAASFHHCRTLHCSGSNVTKDHRRALVLVCGMQPIPHGRPNERPWVVTTQQGPDISF